MPKSTKSARPTSEQAFQRILDVTPIAIKDVNSLTIRVFQTRGGRIGSGLGGVIEALWGFYVNKHLLKSDLGAEMAWISGHEYNDFAVIICDEDWDPQKGTSELFRVEVKSMVRSAKEPKAHFDRLRKEIKHTDTLAVFIWDWVPVSKGSKRCYPKILDGFVGRASAIATLRDELHVARGGTFVPKNKCPDGCRMPCCHIDEPLNPNGVRERKSGPVNSKKGKTTFQANFGGLKRMLGVRGVEAIKTLQKFAKRKNDAAQYVSFIQRNFKRAPYPTEAP